MNVYDTTEVNNLKVGNYFPRLWTSITEWFIWWLSIDYRYFKGNLVWYNTNAPSLQPSNPIDIDSLSDGYFDFRQNLYLGNEPNSIILGQNYATGNIAIGHDTSRTTKTEAQTYLLVQVL